MSNNEDDVGVCTECHSDQPDEYIIKNPFFQSGGAIPCKFCGGIVVIVPRQYRDQQLNKVDNRRGVGYHDPNELRGKDEDD